MSGRGKLMVKRGKTNSKSRLTLKVISLFILSLIVIEVAFYAFSMLSSKPIEVEAKFKQISLYLSQNSYRLCLVYEVVNPKHTSVNVIVVIDLNKADLGGRKINISDVVGVYDKSKGKHLNYDVEGDHILRIPLTLKSNETRTILILL